MRIAEVKVYQFDELSDEAKGKAVEEFLTINVDYDWWDCTYEDAEIIDLKITSFDLDRNKHAKGNFVDCAVNTARKILKEHGNTCETYKTATAFLQKIKDKEKEVGDDEYYAVEEECAEIEEKFLRSILKDYSTILQNEYEYQTSEKVIIETIKANKYEFKEDGTSFYSVKQEENKPEAIIIVRRGLVETVYSNVSFDVKIADFDNQDLVFSDTDKQSEEKTENEKLLKYAEDNLNVIF